MVALPCFSERLPGCRNKAGLEIRPDWWQFAHPAKKRHHGQPLHEDGKGDDGEADGDDFFALWELSGKSKCEGKRQRTSQTAPEQDMLMSPRDAKRGAGKKKTAGIDRHRSTQRY